MDDECRKLIDDIGSPDPERWKTAEHALRKQKNLTCIDWALNEAAIPEHTKEALCRLLYLWRWQEAGPIALRQLDSGNPSVRAEAANILAVTRYQPAGPQLERLLNDGAQPADVKGRAALAIGVLPYHAALPSLITHLQDPDERVRALTAKSLGLLGERSAIAALQLAREYETSQWVLQEIGIALGELSPVAEDGN